MDPHQRKRGSARKAIEPRQHADYEFSKVASQSRLLAIKTDIRAAIMKANMTPATFTFLSKDNYTSFVERLLVEILFPIIMHYSRFKPIGF